MESIIGVYLLVLLVISGVKRYKYPRLRRNFWLTLLAVFTTSYSLKLFQQSHSIAVFLLVVLGFAMISLIEVSNHILLQDKKTKRNLLLSLGVHIFLLFLIYLYS